MLQAIIGQQWLLFLLSPHWLKLLQRLNGLVRKEDSRTIANIPLLSPIPILSAHPRLCLCYSLPEHCLQHSPAHMRSTATMMIISPVCSCLFLSSPSMVMSPVEKSTQAAGSSHPPTRPYLSTINSRGSEKEQQREAHIPLTNRHGMTS